MSAYSRLEKDFLGIEKMVHYDAEGNKTGVQDVVREEDGTIRVVGEPTPVIETPGASIPSAPASQPVPSLRATETVATVPANKTLVYIFGAFIGSAILTFIVLSFFKTAGGGNQVNSSASPSFIDRSDARTENFTQPPIEQTPAPDDTQPRQNDQGVPDTDTEGDGKPRIEQTDPEPTKQDERTNDSDPIDLRGGDEPTPTTNEPTTTPPDDLR
ncbi:MAG TPA: hypothetical protein VK171_04925 [Fimbriimonas sp.]|nr:hypothetical protein [Fimbriimonas sp.]